MTTQTRAAWPDPEMTMITDGGLETWLVFDHGRDLPAFAAYPLAGTEDGRRLLKEYFEHYAAIARSIRAGVVLETPTWRANPDWAATLGHDLDALADLIRASVELVDQVRQRWAEVQPFLISGAIGPRGDGYVVDTSMSPDEAADYHAFQIGCFAQSPVDLVTGITIGYVDEAVGIARAAEAAGLPAVISFTVETDGRLPSGMPLGEAIEATDAATDSSVRHYMVNCAHPTHFDQVLDATSAWAGRIGGLRANASTLSHAELDEMEVLDDGDPSDLAARYVALGRTLSRLQVLGGCCGTDHRHVAAIASAWAAR